MYRPRPVPRLRVGEEGLEQVALDLGAMGGLSLNTESVAVLSSRAASRRKMAPASSLAWPRVVQQVHQHAAQVLGVEGDAQRLLPAGRRAGGCPPQPQPDRGRPFGRGRAHLGGRIDGAWHRRSPGATSITSSTMRLSRSTLSATMRARRCCVDQFVFQQQRVGLRDGRQRVADLVRDAGRHAPIAASFSCRMRASAVRIFEQQHARTGPPQAIRARSPAHERTRMRSVRRAAFEAEGQVAPGFRPGRRVLQRRPPPAPGRARRAGSRAGTAPRASAPSASNWRRRVGGAHAQVVVDHQHAVDHFLDHQSVQLRLLARQLQAAAGRQLLAPRRPASSPDSRVITNRPRPASPDCSISAFRSPPSCADPARPWPAASASPRRRGQRAQSAGQHPAISTGSTSSAAVEGRPGLQHVQAGEHRQVDADGQQPAQPARTGVGLRRTQVR